ncbi:MAG: hypothetical protein AAGA90_17535 [Actinomycetota bacterium]
MELEFEVVEEGYVARVSGTFGMQSAGLLWEEIQAHRPDDGFRFGVIDVRSASTPLLDSWPPGEAVYEVLHPAVRLLRQTVRAGFRAAFVTDHLHAQAMMDDLAELTRYGSPRPPGEAPSARVFADLDAALSWCRDDAMG